MALTGNIRDFGLSEILQLIGHQKKSGPLVITGKNKKVEVLFDQGAIVGAKHEPSRPEFDLGVSLVRARIISGQQMEQFKKEQDDTLRPLGQILLNKEAISLANLRELIALNHREIIYNLFLWKDGDYSFEQGSVSYPQQLVEPISTEEVLMDGYRIKDEWPTITRVIPDTRAVLDKITGEFGPDQKLTADQKSLYDLIDGSITAEDLAFLTRMGRFETMKLLKDLVEKGRISAQGRVEQVRKRDFSAVWLQALAGAVIIIGVIFAVMGMSKSLDFSPGIESPGVAASEALYARYQMEQIENALAMHAALKGGYPESLNRLVSEGELKQEATNTAFGPFEYKSEEAGKACELTLPGLADLNSGEPGG